VLPRDEDVDVVFLSGLIQQNGKWVGLGRCVVMVLGWCAGLFLGLLLGCADW
jgi:hypothetical protein